MPRTLSVVGLGAVGRLTLEAAAAGASQLYDVQTVIDPSLAEPGYAFNPGRKQFHAQAIVRKVAQMQLRPGRDLVLAVGALDLFEPESDWLYGDGDGELRSAVIGLERLRRGADEERFSRRLRLVAGWAVGLALGLRDCDDSRCAMNLPVSVDDLDKRTGLHCNACRQLLLQLQSGRS